MSVSFLQATTAFLQSLLDVVFTGSIVPGTTNGLGSLADVISDS